MITFLALTLADTANSTLQINRNKCHFYQLLSTSEQQVTITFRLLNAWSFERIQEMVWCLVLLSD